MSTAPVNLAGGVRMLGTATEGTAGTAANPVLWSDNATQPNLRYSDGTHTGVGSMFVCAAAVASKGDIAVFNGTNWLPLSVGSNTQVLTADSTQASGIKWAAGGGAASLGNWTFTANDADRSASGALTVGAGGNATSLTVTPKITASGGIFTEAWHEVGAGGQPAFGTNVSNFGGGFTTLAFAKDAAGFVHLKGVYVATLGNGSVLFTLPAGYRPQATTMLNGLSDAAGTYSPARLDIATNGDITAQTVGATLNSLDGLTFSVQ